MAYKIKVSIRLNNWYGEVPMPKTHIFKNKNELIEFLLDALDDDLYRRYEVVQ